jgi:phospholipase/lecithinase/hemolysin
MQYCYVKHDNYIKFEITFSYVGFATSKVACCGQGPYNGIGLCTPVSNLCEDRNAYVFWDAFHPSERANRMIVDRFMIGSSEYMHPMNLSTIMLLDSRT